MAIIGPRATRGSVGQINKRVVVIWLCLPNYSSSTTGRLPARVQNRCERDTTRHAPATSNKTILFNHGLKEYKLLLMNALYLLIS